MRFVDFSRPDPASERAERFTLAAQRAMAEGEYRLAAQRLVYARDAEPRNATVLRQMTLAFWNAGQLEAAGRAVRDWARVEDGPAAHRFAARIYEEMGAIDLAAQAAERATASGPGDAGGWERLGRLRLALLDREGALDALRRALALGADGQARELLVQALKLEPGARNGAGAGSASGSGASGGQQTAPVAETA
jgi:thioredoxin-like negative regulator of GroEL